LIREKPGRIAVLVILTQAEIAAKIGQDAAEVFSGLYAEYLPKVYRYISYRIADTHLAEDLTSAVFEKALTKFQSFKAEKASFSTWIFTIARNTLTDHYRVNSKVQTVDLDDQVDAVAPELSPEEMSDKNCELQQLQSCVSQLSKIEQEIISLKFGAEMTNRQIAKSLSLTESNVGIIIYRAVRKLRDSFRGEQNG
jgi:RNA polymerase sigma factor (sigma-70 family)